MPRWIYVVVGLCILLPVTAGCSRGPARVPAPSIDPDSAADKAIELYDTDHDRALSDNELARCPGIRTTISLYDQDGNRSIDREEIIRRLSDLLKNRVGLTQLRSRVTYRGRPLPDAQIVFEPEPYLGDEVQVAEGTTNSHGSAQIGIAEEYLPENVRNMKLVHYGTYKVRITHPTIKLPSRYNSETTLGYETRIGDPFATFALTDR
jgi:hypothetical protein